MAEDVGGQKSQRWVFLDSRVTPSVCALDADS
jgi:hypothetical protein